MGPRLFDGERKLDHPQTRVAREGFNGAPSVRRGKGPAGPSLLRAPEYASMGPRLFDGERRPVCSLACRSLLALQWGPVCSTGKGYGIQPVSFSGTGFQWGP